MGKCLSEKSLWSIHEGGGNEAEKVHLESCLGCARRYRALDDDLKQIVSALNSPPPPSGISSFAGVLRWSLAAALVISAFALGRFTIGTLPGASGSQLAQESAEPSAAAPDGSLAFADVAATYALYLDDLVGARDEQDATQVAADDGWNIETDGL